MNKSLKAKLLTFSVMGLILVNSFIQNDIKSADCINATQTIEELEALKAENEKKIKQLQEEIKKSQEKYATIVEDEKAKLEYQETLNEKIALQNQNIDYVVNQIKQIDEDITENKNRILVIESDIFIKKAEIEHSMQLFKKRLRVSYMSGNDNLAAVLTGSADFYDLLAKMELVSKIAERDDEIIDILGTQLEELDELNKALAAKQNELEISMAESEDKKAEFDVLLEQLVKDNEKTQQEIDLLQTDKQEIQVDIAAKESAIAQKEKEHEKFMADIAAAQEAIRIEQSKKAEESRKLEESRRAEESRKAEESKLAAQQSQKPSVTAPPVATTPAITQAVSSSQGFVWPVPGYYLPPTSYYGYRSFDNSFHKGIDLGQAGIAGAAIVAIADGVVVTAKSGCTHNVGKNYSCGCGGGYGNYVTIAHSDGTYSSLYAHCQSICVSSGQYVTQGQTIGYVGTTGYSTGNHLHFEVHKNGNTVDPLSVVSPY